VNRQRVAERDEIRGALGSRNSGNPGNGQGIALGYSFTAQLRCYIRTDGHQRAGCGLSLGYIFLNNIHHMCCA
jgi:hypothetical protein